MGEIPDTEQVGHATTWFTSQAGITATVLAFVCIALAAYIVWRERENKRERREDREELYGSKERGLEGIIPGLMKKIETMRLEEWASIDNMLASHNDGLKALEERRRVDSISQFGKLDGVLEKVTEMSQGDLEHHSRVEAQVAEAKGALREQSARLGDMINLATMITPQRARRRG